MRFCHKTRLAQSAHYIPCLFHVIIVFSSYKQCLVVYLGLIKNSFCHLSRLTLRFSVLTLCIFIIVLGKTLKFLSILIARLSRNFCLVYLLYIPQNSCILNYSLFQIVKFLILKCFNSFFLLSSINDLIAFYNSF